MKGERGWTDLTGLNGHQAVLILFHVFVDEGVGVTCILMYLAPSLCKPHRLDACLHVFVCKVKRKKRRGKVRRLGLLS